MVDAIMAKLPSADQLVRQTPTPANKQAVNDEYRPVDASAIGEATARLGSRIAGVGTDVFNSQVAQERQDAADREALRVQTDKLDTLRAEEAVNLLRQKEQELTLGDKGYTRYKSAEAIERKSPLIDEYSKSYDDAITQVESILHTPAQKEKFRQRAAGVSLSFKAGLLKHTSEQAEKYKDDVYSGTIATEQQGMTTKWFNPAEVDKSKLRIAEVIADAYHDKPAELKTAKLNEALSKLNKSVVESAISAGQIGFAEGYIKKNASGMSVDDLVGFSDKIKKVREDETVTKVVSDVISQVPSMVNPSDGDRLTALVIKAGLPEGAIAEGAQFTDKEKMVIGKDMLRGMLTKFNGNVAEAMAAYFSGQPRIVDDAKKVAEKQGGNWTDYLPSDVGAKVGQVVSGYQAGDNPMPEPTLLDVKKAVKLRTAGMPQSVVDKALAKAEAEFNDIRTDKDQRGEKVLESVMARVDGRLITRYDQLSTEELQTLGTKRTSAKAYIESMNKAQADILELSPAATTMYYAMYTDPVTLKSKSISDIMAMAPDLGQSRVNSLLQKRAQYINQPDSEKAATIDSDQFRALALKFGFENKTVKGKQELIILEDRVKEIITNSQNDSGKSLTRDQKDVIIKRAMTEFDVKAKRAGRWDIFGGEDTVIKKRGYQIENPANVIVPDNIKQQIIQSYAKYGSTPTESQIREDYAAYLASQKVGR